MRPLRVFATLLILFCVFATTAFAQPPANGSEFPDITLPAHPNATEHNLPVGEFALSDLSEDLIVLHVYSWFCAPCQKDGPKLVELDELIRERGLQNRIRLLGLAAGDDMSLVNRYVKRHNIPFAMFPDQTMRRHIRVGGVPVPYFFIIKRDGRALTVLHQQAGMLENVGEFVDKILEVDKE